MRRIAAILIVIILVCLCVLAWINVFIWHDAVIAAVFTASVIVWLLILSLDSNN